MGLSLQALGPSQVSLRRTYWGERKGKLRVIGRVAGQMIETMYALLKRDAEILSTIPPGQEPPHLSCMTPLSIADIERVTTSH